MSNRKPLVSIIIIFFNQEDYVDSAIDGALSQTYENCEIILSDDCSTDGTYNRILEKTKSYNGNKKIIINRNEKNIGLVPHVNKVIYELSHGEYILLTGGDDISLPNRAKDSLELFLANPEVSMLTLSCIIIDKSGIEQSKRLSKDKLINYESREFLQPSSFWVGNLAMAYRRDIIYPYGPLSDNCQTEDSPLRFRSILKGPILTSSIIGLKYRVHGNNISIGNVRFKLKGHEIAEQYRKDLLANINVLSRKSYRMLQKKIDFYEHYREISTKQVNTSNAKKKMLYRFRHLMMRLLYRASVAYYYYNK